MLSRFLSRSLSGDSLSRSERTMTHVMFVIIELFGALFVAAVASMIAGIFGDESAPTAAGTISLAIYFVVVLAAWLMPAKRRG